MFSKFCPPTDEINLILLTLFVIYNNKRLGDWVNGKIENWGNG
jgi:hypothetical protein